MRVLQVYKDVYPEVSGGIERYLADLSRFLHSRGHTVEIAVAGGGERTLEGIPVHGIPELCRILSNPLVPGLSAFLKNTDADAVHFHLPLPSAVLAWLQASCPVPYVVTYHSDIVRQAFAMPFYAPFLRRFLAGASSVVATSGKYASSSPFLKNLRNVTVIPIGVDSKLFHPGNGGGGSYYLFAGRFRKYKGLNVLLEAWRILEEPPDLIMAGGGGVEDRLKSNAAAWGLPVQVRTDVSDQELRTLYASARALILPSIRRSEAFGMVQLEAMACGTPVISSDLQTGVSWVNVHGRTGLHFRTGDPEDLARAVMIMEKDEDFRKRAGVLARKRAIEEFDPCRLFERVEDCLKKAAAD